jgi:hypothetical protein
MDKVKAFVLAPGRARMLAVLFFLVVVVLKVLGLGDVAQSISFIGYVLPQGSPVNADEATAAVLSLLALVKWAVQTFKAKAA